MNCIACTTNNAPLRFGPIGPEVVTLAEATVFPSHDEAFHAATSAGLRDFTFYIRATALPLSREVRAESTSPSRPSCPSRDTSNQPTPPTP